MLGRALSRKEGTRSRVFLGTGVRQGTLMLRGHPSAGSEDLQRGGYPHVPRLNWFQMRIKRRLSWRHVLRAVREGLLHRQ
jgi:hypothetical protein